MREGANKTLITMKKLLMIFAILFAATTVSAQEIYNEVKKIQKQAETFANDTTKNLDERKIACFKYDAIYYLVDRASQEDRFTEYELGQQTDALIEFVNLYVKRLSQERKKKDKDIVLALFKNASCAHPLFDDPDKEVTYGYVDNEQYITQFALDTDWVKALKEILK